MRARALLPALLTAAVTVTSAAGATTSFNVDQNAHLALFGVNYRFGGNPVGPWR